MTNNTATSTKTAETGTRKRGRFGLVMLAAMALVLAMLAVAALALTGREVSAPNWVVARIEDKLNNELAVGTIRLGGADLLIGETYTPTVRIRDVKLIDGAGTTLVRLDNIQAVLSRDAVLSGKLQPELVTLSGAQLRLRRRADGRFDISMGEVAGAAGSLAEVLDAVDRLFMQPTLSSIAKVEADSLTFTFEDARANKLWRVDGGRIWVDQDHETLSIRTDFDLLGNTDEATTAAFSFETVKGSPAAQFGFTFENMDASDIASQSPALAFLGVLDAPISGALRTSVMLDGQLGAMNGTLEIGKGAVQPTAETRPIGFSSGRAYFGYNPATKKITFNELSVKTDVASVAVEGHAYLRDLTNGWPATLLGQFKFSEVAANPDGIFSEPVKFSGGAVDLRLRLDPFEVTIGQIALFDGDNTLLASGKIEAAPKGWKSAMDLSLDGIAHDRLLALWPVELATKTRNWITQNVRTGVLSDIRGALRLTPEQPAVFTLGFEFDKAEARVMKTLPDVTGGRGHAQLENTTFTLVLDQGRMKAPEGGVLNLAGTVFKVPKIREKPAKAEITLLSRSPIHAALSILDQPPFQFLTKAEKPVDLAEGQLAVTAQIRTPLMKKVPLSEVDYNVTGVLRDVVSDSLVQGRTLRASDLTVSATPKGLQIGGAGRLDAVPLNVTWEQKFGPAARGKSRVEGTVTLSQTFVDTFNIGLPKGSVSGATPARIEMDLAKGQAPRFRLISDLNRLGLGIPAINWTKPKNSTGRLEVAGTLGPVPVIETLEIDASGLRASGKISLGNGGVFKSAEFSRVQLGEWLDGPVVLTGQGKGRPLAVAVRGGTIDVRKTTFGRAKGSGEGGPISLALDRLTISDGLSLSAFRGDFNTAGGFNGAFSGQVNGAAPITGTLAPQKGGTAVRLQSQDAGAVLAAAGFAKQGRDGQLDVILLPRAERGSYDGRLSVKNIRIMDAPALAGLLSAISVVGLLEQLNGQGIVFSEIDADFHLTPTAVIVTRSSAVGASLGVSMDGIYELEPKTMDMQGVISPIYLLNGIGSIFTRRGEGLFGFNFTLNGPTSAPRVGVNPLSILTPGMFRELFRRPPPKLSQ